MTETPTRARAWCARCQTQGWAPPHRVEHWTCSDCRRSGKTPDARNVDWPALVATCEARGIPALRVDEHGGLHVIRTSAQLAAEWEA